MHTEIVRKPLIEPVTLEEVKDYLHIEHDTEDNLLAHFIQSAREYIEEFVGRAFMTQVRRVTFLGQRGRRKRYFLSSAPFLNLEGPVLLNGQPYQAYHLIKGMGQAMLCLHYPLQENDQLAVTFSCGYGENPQDVPTLYRHAILIKVGELYHNRSGTAKADTSYLRDLLAHTQSLRFV